MWPPAFSEQNRFTRAGGNKLLIHKHNTQSNMKISTFDYCTKAKHTGCFLYIHWLHQLWTVTSQAFQLSSLKSIFDRFSVEYSLKGLNRIAYYKAVHNYHSKVKLRFCSPVCFLVRIWHFSCRNVKLLVPEDQRDRGFYNSFSSVKDNSICVLHCVICFIIKQTLSVCITKNSSQLNIIL